MPGLNEPLLKSEQGFPGFWRQIVLQSLTKRDPRVIIVLKTEFDGTRRVVSNAEEHDIRQPNIRSYRRNEAVEVHQTIDQMNEKPRFLDHFIFLGVSDILA